MGMPFDYYHYFCFCRILKLINMNTAVQLSPNVLFIQDEAFGKTNLSYISDVVQNIDIAFSNALSIPHFSSRRCVIRYNYYKNNPMYCKSSEEGLIYLHAKCKMLSKWIYQFAHEYCHHIINGSTITGIKGLLWFEETICELSSIYHLNNLCNVWTQSHELHHRYLSLQVRDYLNDLLEENPELCALTLRPKFLQSWDSLLKENEYHRDHYNAIAVRIFPLFVENPHLWKIILHLGNSCQWNSLEELFVHLHRNSDDSYSHSLVKLENLLLS